MKNISVHLLLETFMLCFPVGIQNSVQAAENAIKRHEAFITTMDANDEKINAVLQFANRLMDENHYAADKIHKKAENINERWVISQVGNVWFVDLIIVF